MQDLQQLKKYTPQKDLLKNKNILVTGAGDGIGRAAALSYAKHGATVILLGRSQAKLEQVYDEIQQENYREPLIAPFDLSTTDEATYTDLGNTLKSSLGTLDGLLHNAGELGELKPLMQYDSSTFKKLIDTNLVSNFMLTKAMLPALLAAPSASIIFTSSSVGRKGRAYWGAYAISKFGVEGLMQTWADELKNTSTIRCNSLNPGATNTAMRRQAYPAEATTANPAPADIMGAYLFLMGNDSLNVNSQQLDAQA